MKMKPTLYIIWHFKVYKHNEIKIETLDTYLSSEIQMHLPT